MPRFDRYMLSQLMVLFGFFSLVLVLVLWVNRAVRLFDQLIGDGQTALVFLGFSALTLPVAIAAVLPIACFACSGLCDKPNEPRERVGGGSSHWILQLQACATSFGVRDGRGGFDVTAVACFDAL
jgi:hypothetical protein